MYFKGTENRAIYVIFGAKEVAELDQDTRGIGILFTGREVAARLPQSPGSSI
jgi:hypothetical protein